MKTQLFHYTQKPRHMDGLPPTILRDIGDDEKQVYINVSDFKAALFGLQSFCK